MEAGERFFSILPTNHAIDFMTGFLMPLGMFGATVVHQRSLRPEFLRFTMKKLRRRPIWRPFRAYCGPLKERINEKLARPGARRSGPRLIFDAADSQAQRSG